MNFDADTIVTHSSDVVDMVMAFFAHRKKAEAVVAGAVKVARDRPMADRLANLSETEALEYLESFPFIGKVTRYHLARNVGFDVVKPDRHLVRLAQAYDCDSPDTLVSVISEQTGERKGFIDYILWQWMAWGGQPQDVN